MDWLGSFAVKLNIVCMFEMGTWNVRRVTGIGKREVVDAFRNGKFKFTFLTEMKIKVGEILQYGVNIICSSTKEERGKGSLTVFLKDVGLVQDRSEWRGFVTGNAFGVARGMNPRP